MPKPKAVVFVFVRRAAPTIAAGVTVPLYAAEHFYIVTDKIEDELKEVLAEILRLETLLGDARLILGVVRQDLQMLKEKYGDERRTRIQDISGAISEEDLIPEVDVLVTLTNRANLANPQLPQDVTRNGVVIKKSSPNILMAITILSDGSRDPNERPVKPKSTNILAPGGQVDPKDAWRGQADAQLKSIEQRSRELRDGHLRALPRPVRRLPPRRPGCRVLAGPHSSLPVGGPGGAVVLRCRRNLSRGGGRG